MKIAITGASGHIGAAVCRVLLEAGHDLTALVHSDQRGIAGLPLRTVSGSILDPNSLDALTKDAEVLVHLASLISIGNLSKSILEEVNIRGTQAVLAACTRNGVRRLVYFSSVHAYKTPAHVQAFDENIPLANALDFPYAQTKAAAQRLVVQEKQLETIVLNPSSVLGPWDFKPSLQGKMLLDFTLGRIPLLPPGGFDWVDNRDVAKVVLAALTQGVSGEAYLLTGRYASVQEMANMVCQLAGRKPPILSAPMWTLKMALPLLQAWSWALKEPPLYTAESLIHLQEGHPNISSEKARLAFGFEARPLETTVQDALDWLLNKQ
ncbi:MAG: NAD-dependent epimerase/dehydratase family protein [Lewinellaceae bacterium]|nr:NAD-dependent epimerase/dehydratase family protein [Lewinellaceae bacterium]